MTAIDKRNLGGCRFAVFGKGGSGKSTAVVLLGQALRGRGYDVYILDADSTNVGLHQALGITRSPISLLDFYGGMVFSGGAVTCPVDDPTPLVGGDVLFDELPPAYCAQNPQGIHLLVAGKIGGMGPGAGCDGPISKIARDFRIRTHEGNEVMLIDCKAGFEDSARGVVTNVDWVIQVVDPTAAAVEMAISMNEMVQQIKAGVPPAVQHLEDASLADLATRLFREARVKGVLVVLSRICGWHVADLLRDKLSPRGIEPIGVIRDDPSIPVSWLRGEPLATTYAHIDAVELVDALEAAVSGAAVGATGASIAG